MVQLRRVVRGAAVLAVLALLALLIWHATTTRRGGGALVAAVQHERLPVAPPFDLPAPMNRTSPLR